MVRDDSEEGGEGAGEGAGDTPDIHPSLQPAANNTSNIFILFLQHREPAKKLRTNPFDVLLLVRSDSLTIVTEDK